MKIIRKIGIDLGTANILVHVPKQGIVINEPSVVALSIDDNTVVAIGAEARDMLGRTPDSIVAMHPLRDGVIADYRTTEAMLRYFIHRATGGLRFFKPEVMVAVPAGITSTERRAVIDATLRAGARAAYIIKEPVAAAIGAGIAISEASGNMIVDIGGGTTEIAVLSLGGIVASTSVRVAGNKIDAAIAEYIRKKHSLAIGLRAAEEVKIHLGSALPSADNEMREVRGRDLISGLPKTITVSSHEVTEAIQDQLHEILQAIRGVLQQTPPELSADISDKGMVISGGGALLRHIDELIRRVTGVPCTIAEQPLLCVGRGTGIALDHLEEYKRSVLAARA